MTSRPLRVFLCHSSADKPAVRELYQKLRNEPWIQPWLDEEELFPGMDWNSEIQNAIRETDAIIVCLSKGSITKEGYVQREIKTALDYSDEKPERTVYIIPVRLEECKPPERLSKWQYADYFEGQREQGVKRLFTSLKIRADSLGLNLVAAVSGKNIKTFEDVYKQAVKILQDEGLVSRSTLQKHLKITYTTATCIIDMMEEKNIVFSENGTSFYKAPDSNLKSEELPFEPINLAKPNNTQFKQKPMHTGDKLTLSNGMEFMRVPAGKFTMGSDNGRDDEKPQHIIDIPYDYWMARYPVTNRQYNIYVEAKEIYPVSDWQNKKDHPVVDLGWSVIKEYCDWLNIILNPELPSEMTLRLPTEAEWEKAARGIDGREYPWGNTFDFKKCNISSYSLPNGGFIARATTPVNNYSPQGESPYGCADMAGNVWEWTHSKYKEYPYIAADGREDEKTKAVYVVRGGAYYNGKSTLRCAFRGGGDSLNDSSYRGFRVCIAPPLPK